MLEIDSLEDIAALRESVDVECKLAQGRDGKGALPKEFWPTYSAFANTQGGDIFLGVRERSGGRFELAGVADPQKVLDDLWTGLNNSQKVSINLLRDRWVRTLEIDGKSVVHIHVPAATRQQKPVYLRGNPLTGTYRRFNSTDHLLGEEQVRRMLAEQVEDSRDNEILPGFGLDDLDVESFNQYRQLYANLQPDHPWNQHDAQAFLYQIGGWRRDRETGRSGLTRAGLLMFGQQVAIIEAFPNYMLDYQERPEPKAELRWVDRLTLDGSWSGNVFDFYRRVIRKLTADLKVPFALEGDQRQDDTLVHKALREALVNTLVHADYTGRASILVVKRPDMFGFRNPGLMRVPADQAMAGGHSDCRNRLLQNMFRYVGLGENAGSGLPKIFQGWSSQHWRKPVLREAHSPSDQTLLELHMLSLVPESVLAELRGSLGESVFADLSDKERLILVTAVIEKAVNHRRMMSILDIHPRDLSQLLSGLVEKGLMLRNGAGQGTVYFLPDAHLEDIFTELEMAEGDAGVSTGPFKANSEPLDTSSGPLEASSGPLETSSGPLEASSGPWEALQELARPIAEKGKAPKAQVEEVILALCCRCPLRLDELTRLLNRSAESLRKHYLQPMVRARRLKLLYPTKPNHPQQAYITEESVHDQ
ncbi:RNA-binding domain-containing protein [Franzmannia qiaohouensis]|uniref:DNA binding domain-containing protein n=1 Tax=Franzmannia qiaohouensis TaxID=1329370 RepID=A0ABU1HBF8_9GAMM|nr:RNA-binding domain-containing protein [Halomonas qiaohouensis]MDR5904801.1 putative DNA binding domain-containing protein [Halomonas qiaohouensis]